MVLSPVMVRAFHSPISLAACYCPDSYCNLFAAWARHGSHALRLSFGQHLCFWYWFSSY
jgi:hypothetical protein